MLMRQCCSATSSNEASDPQQETKLALDLTTYLYCHAKESQPRNSPAIRQVVLQVKIFPGNQLALAAPKATLRTSVFRAPLSSQNMRVRHVPHDYQHGPTFVEEKISASGGSGGGEARKPRATLCVVQLQAHCHRHICATIL
jgi:hypothetical protein